MHTPQDIVLTAVPNPNSGQFTVRIFNPYQREISVEVVDDLGAIIWYEKFDVGEMPIYWEHVLSLPQNQSYFVSARSGDARETIKVMITI